MCVVVLYLLYPGTEARPQARGLADRNRRTCWLPAPVAPGTQPRMVTCRVGAARGGRVAIVILATVPQRIACLYTVPRAASMGPEPWQACRGGRAAAARTTTLPMLNTSAQCGRGDLAWYGYAGRECGEQVARPRLRECGLRPVRQAENEETSSSRWLLV
jgi:hypothetical protein